jgi:regulator of replication initiation timing
MGEGHWKNKLTVKQLERKRLGDREKQRLRRKQHSDSAEQLESKLSLLLAKSESEAVKALIDENVILRTETETLRGQLNRIFRLTAELPQDVAMAATIPRSTRREASSDSAVSEPPRAETRASILRHQSVLRQVAKAAVCGDGSSPRLFSVDGLIESVLGWKLTAGHALGLAFLTDCPLDEQFQDIHILGSENFYGGLVAAVYAGRADFSANALHPVETPGSILSDLELQDRYVALYAFLLVGSWLAKLPSKLERTVHFWVAYSLCKVW